MPNDQTFNVFVGIASRKPLLVVDEPYRRPYASQLTAVCALLATLLPYARLQPSTRSVLSASSGPAVCEASTAWCGRHSKQHCPGSDTGNHAVPRVRGGCCKLGVGLSARQAGRQACLLAMQKARFRVQLLRLFGARLCYPS